MSAVEHLVSMGVWPVSEDGKLGLLGVKALDPEKARAVLDYARKNKLTILAELEIRAEHPKDVYTRMCGGYWESCTTCPDYHPLSVYFCRKLRDESGGWLQ